MLIGIPYLLTKNTMKKKLKPDDKSSLSLPVSNGSTVAKAAIKQKTEKVKSTSNGKVKAKSIGNGNGLFNLNVAYSGELDSRELVQVLTAVKEGDFSVRLPDDKLGISGKICDTLNQIISLNEMLMEELSQAKNTIGKKGHLNH